MGQDKEGLLWCAGYKGLLKYNLTTNQHHWLYLFNRKKNFHGFNRMNGHDFDSDKIVLVASAGVVFFDKKKEWFSKLQRTEMLTSTIAGM